MKNFLTLFSSLCIGLLLSCNNNSESREFGRPAEGKDQGMLQESAWTAGEDASFLEEAYSNNLLILSAIKMAEQEVQTLALKDFVNQSAAYYQNLNRQIVHMGKLKSVSLNEDLVEGERKNLEELSKKEGDEFEKAFLKELKEILKEQKDLFEEASENALDSDIRNWAAKIWSNLKMHITAVEELEEDI